MTVGFNFNQASDEQEAEMLKKRGGELQKGRLFGDLAISRRFAAAHSKSDSTMFLVLGIGGTSSVEC